MTPVKSLMPLRWNARDQPARNTVSPGLPRNRDTQPPPSDVGVQARPTLGARLFQSISKRSVLAVNR
jgi:hypothetical protein